MASHPFSQDSLGALADLFETEFSVIAADFLREAGADHDARSMAAMAIALGAGRALARLPAILFPGDPTAPAPVATALKSSFDDVFEEALADLISRGGA